MNSLKIILKYQTKYFSHGKSTRHPDLWKKSENFDHSDTLHTHAKNLYIENSCLTGNFSHSFQMLDAGRTPLPQTFHGKENGYKFPLPWMGVVRIQNVFKENSIDYTVPKSGWFNPISKGYFLKSVTFKKLRAKQALEIIQLSAFTWWMRKETQGSWVTFPELGSLHWQCWV